MFIYNLPHVSVKSMEDGIAPVAVEQKDRLRRLDVVGVSLEDWKPPQMNKKHKNNSK